MRHLTSRSAKAACPAGDAKVWTMDFDGELRARAAEPAVAEELDELNRELLSRIEKSGEAFVSNAIVDGSFALRMCIVNFRSTEADVDALPEIVLRHARQVRGAGTK
jgi:hypothetical protein